MSPGINFILTPRSWKAIWVYPLLWWAGAAQTSGAEAARVFRAGAYAMDITPTDFPVIVNGGFFEAITDKAFDTLHARCLALEDGQTRVVICVIDSCLIPREFMDGNTSPEISGEAAPRFTKGSDALFLGGRSDGCSGLEGKLDEVAVYARALTAGEMAGHFKNDLWRSRTMPCQLFCYV